MIEQIWYRSHASFNNAYKYDASCIKNFQVDFLVLGSHTTITSKFTHPANGSVIFVWKTIIPNFWEKLCFIDFTIFFWFHKNLFPSHRSLDWAAEVIFTPVAEAFPARFLTPWNVGLCSCSAPQTSCLWNSNLWNGGNGQSQISDQSCIFLWQQNASAFFPAAPAGALL